MKTNQKPFVVFLRGAANDPSRRNRRDFTLGSDGGRRCRQGDRSARELPGFHRDIGPARCVGLRRDRLRQTQALLFGSLLHGLNNGTSPDRFLPDNGIYVYNLRTRSERAVVTAADMPGGKGFIGKISLSFDVKKILFDFRQDPGSGFRIWEVKMDGSGLRQISFPPPDEAEKAARWYKGWHTDDIHPCYLPDGKIIFSSTRCEHTVLCGGSAQPCGSRPAPDGRRRRPCRAAHQEPGQRILPGGSR